MTNVAVFLVYYSTPEQRKLLDKLLGTGKLDGITSQINTDIGEITMPYDGVEPENLWLILNKLSDENLKNSLKQTRQNLKGKMK